MLATAAIPSWRHTAGPLISVCPLSEGRIDLQRAKQTPRPRLYISQTYTTRIYYAWPCAQTRRSPPFLLCVPALFRLSRRLLDRLRASLAPSLRALSKVAKWHPGGNQKHALASLSRPLEILWDQLLAPHWLQANTQAQSMKTCREIWELLLLFWVSFLCQSARGNHRTSDPLLSMWSSCTGSNTKKMKNL